MSFRDDAMCPQCGRLYFVAGFETPWGGVVGRLRCACPQQSARWATEAALAYRERERSLRQPADYDTWRWDKRGAR